MHRNGALLLALYGLALFGLALLGWNLLAAEAAADHIDNSFIAPLDPPATVPGPATIQTFTDYETWAQASSGLLQSNRFADVLPGEIITTQYEWAGATYSDGDDIALPYLFSTDGMIMQGHGRVHIAFDRPITGIAIDYPGAIRIIAFRDGEIVFTSPDFGDQGHGHFAGIVSDGWFDSVELLDWFDDLAFVDDVHYAFQSSTQPELTTWGKLRVLFHMSSLP